MEHITGYCLAALLISHLCIDANAQEYIKHIVKRGDTISSISKSYGIPESKIIELNPKTTQFIYVGMELRLPPATKDLKSGQEYEVISTSRLNVRSKPDAKSSVIGSLCPKDVIDVRAIAGSWAKIEYKGRMAYVSSKYIRKIEVKKELAEYDVSEKENITDYGHINKPLLLLSETKKDTVDDSSSFFDNVTIDFVPSIAGGFSNFASDKVNPKERFGLGVDLAFQFIAENSIIFIPKDYFIDISLGYSLKGSAAFPMHYITMKFSPIGYRYHFSDFTLLGNFGCYTGFTTSNIKTGQYSFNSNLDFGISAEIGAEYLGVGLALAYERGFVKVCDSNLKLKNSGLFLKLSCRLFDVRDVLNINK